MNILLAGVHGVGKTYLARKLPSTLGFFHTSASKLIAEELAMPNWSVDKKVENVEANQIALAEAVKRYNLKGTRLLLDGHFVLIDKNGQFVSLGSNVFSSLNLSAAVLLEADPQVILQRIADRDNRNVSLREQKEFLEAERANAELVCEQIMVPLRRLHAPTEDAFVQCITELG